jgi:hypothetical protein
MISCSSLNSTLRTILARLHVSDTDGFPSRGILSVIGMFRQLHQFNQPQFVLVNNNFEFPDLLGAAYEYLIKFFADHGGK